MKVSKLLVLGALAGLSISCGGEEGGAGASEGELGSIEQAVFRSIPVRVEAESFERFSDFDTLHSGNCGTGPVDQEVTTDPNGGACNVGWTKAGEWLEYDLNAATPGSYNFTFRLASNVAARVATVRLDNAVIGTVTAPVAGWQTWEDRTISNVNVAAGNHTLRVTFDTDDINFNYVNITQNAGPVCGDGTCNGTETCSTCTQDCGSCSGRNIANNLEAEANDGQVGLQFEACSEGGQNAGYVDPNDTVQWNIAVPTTGNYTVTVRSATWAATSLKVLVDNVEKATLNLPATWTSGANQYQTWQSFTTPAIALTQGTRSLKLQFTSGTQNLNWAKVTAATVTGVTVPARLEAEAYDAFNDSTPANNQGNACNRNPVDGVDKEATTDPGGGCNVGWTTAGEWLEYNIQSPSAQTVNIVSRVASGVAGKRFHVERDGVTVGGLQTAPSAGWQAFSDRTVTGVSLTAGAHKLRVVFDDGDVNLNYLNVVASTPVACVNPDPQGSTSLGISRADIKARIVASGIAGAVRIARSPLNSSVYVLDINGGIYRIDSLAAGVRSTVVFPNVPQDPTPTVLEQATAAAGLLEFRTVQGFAFGLDGKLYVVANSGGANNVAVILRGTPNGNAWTWQEVARTVPYLNSGTPFDHQWSGIVVNREAGVDYLYINSGSRTDHGELQSGAREFALTAGMFRLPATLTGATLQNDRTTLVNAGYLFAEGLRNSFDPTVAPDGKIVSADNGPDSDYHEELNWIQQGRHYGFPWRLGNEDNTVQFSWYDPTYITNNYATPADNHDPRLHPLFHGYDNRLYSYQATLGTKPPTFTDPILSIGPDADSYRDINTRGVNDASARGEKIGTFTGHRSPLGLSFDAANALCTDFRGDAFVLSWGSAHPIADMPDSNGQDLLHLDLMPTSNGTGFEIRATRLVTGFDRPIDSIFIGNRLYVLENGASGRIFEISLPIQG